MTDTQELAYKRKAKLRKKHRKVRVELVSVEENGQKFKFFTNNKKLVEQLQWCSDNNKFPFMGKLRRMNQSGNPDFRIVGTKA